MNDTVTIQMFITIIKTSNKTGNEVSCEILVYLNNNHSVFDLEIEYNPGKE